MRKMLIVLMATVALLAVACGSDDDTDEATATTEAPETTTTTAAPETTTTTAAPDTTTTTAAPDTSEPDLKDLSREEVVLISEAREDFIISCVASTEETNEERCILIWNCAVNEVGVSVAADAAQRATLDEALDNCSQAVP